MEIKMDKKKQDFSKLLFKESSIKSEWLPIDFDFLKSKREDLAKINLEDFIIFNFNNFPEIYNHRILLCLIEDLLKIDRKGWLKIIDGIQQSLSFDSFWLFMHIYLKVKPSAITKETFNKELSFYDLDSLEMDEDDINFIKHYSIQKSINTLIEKLKSYNLVDDIIE